MVPQTHVVDSHPACWLAFTEDAVITSCKQGKIPSHANLMALASVRFELMEANPVGHVRTWNRPGVPTGNEEKA
jgi:hypothetical protein